MKRLSKKGRLVLLATAVFFAATFGSSHILRGVALETYVAGKKRPQWLTFIEPALLSNNHRGMTAIYNRGNEEEISFLEMLMQKNHGMGFEVAATGYPGYPSSSQRRLVASIPAFSYRPIYRNDRDHSRVRLASEKIMKSALASPDPSISQIAFSVQRGKPR